MTNAAPAAARAAAAAAHAAADAVVAAPAAATALPTAMGVAKDMAVRPGVSMRNLLFWSGRVCVDFGNRSFNGDRPNFGN